MAGALNTSHLLGLLGFQVVAINGAEVNGLPSGGAYSGLNFITAGASASLNPITKAVDITLPAGGGGGGTPGGTLGMIQYFDGADFAGASDVIWTPGSRLLEVGGAAGSLLRAANASGDGFAPLELRNLASDAVPILRLNGTGANGANVQFHSGTRNPSGVVSGNTGDIYVQSAIGIGTANLWQNTGAGTSSTWTKFATGTATGDVIGPASSNSMDGAESDDSLDGVGNFVGIPVFADASGKLLKEFPAVDGGFLRAVPGGEVPGRLEWTESVPGFWVDPSFLRDAGDLSHAARFYSSNQATGASTATGTIHVGHRNPNGVVNSFNASLYMRDNDGGHNALYIHRGDEFDPADNTGTHWDEVHAGPDLAVDSVAATGDISADTATVDVLTVTTAIDATSGPGVGSVVANHVAALQTLQAGSGAAAVEVDSLGRVGFSRDSVSASVSRAHAPYIVGSRSVDSVDIVEQLLEALSSMGLVIDATTA